MADQPIRGSSCFPGPPGLGRSIVVRPGQEAPRELAGAARVRVDEGTLDDPAAAVAALRTAWATRQPTVVELAVDPDELTRPETETRPPYALGHRFWFPREQLRFLVWANSYDLRGGRPVWWHGVLAGHLAGVERSTRADVSVTGQPAWVDGGPRGPLPARVTGGHALLHRESVELGTATLDHDAAPASGELAPDQLAAVTHASGPARVIAPAGSGKTRVLTARLRHLLADRAVQAGAVTALAYNTRAAQEMRARTADLGAQIQTIHSLGYEIVRAVRPGVEVLHEPQVRDIVARLAPVDLEPNRDVHAPYLEALAQVRLGLLPPEQVERTRPDVPGLARLLPAYRERLRARGAIDYDEQIYGAVEALLADADIRERFQRRARHLLVDEFQDLTPAFLLLIRLVAAPAWQVYGVGDDDQTIYGHMGADPGFLVHYGRHFPHAAPHALEVNYRCPPAVVDATAGLVAHNRHRVPKAVRPAPGRRDPPDALRVACVDTHEQTGAAVARVTDVLAGGTAPGEVAVLCRVNALLLPVQVALFAAGVPATSPVGIQVLRRTGMRVALAWLRLAVALPGELAGGDLAEALRRADRPIRGETLRRLAARAGWSRRELVRLAFDHLSVWEGKELRAFLDDLAEVARAARTSTAAALAAIRTLGGLDAAAESLDRSGARTAASHRDDLDALAQTAALHPEAATFEAWLRDLLAASPRERAGDRVQLATVHATKGLEYDHVVVYAANRGLLPHRLSADTPAALEEERRVLHVALTRCRRSVTVVADRGAPSPFLAELRGGTPGQPAPG